jgi:hypothetical protein
MWVRKTAIRPVPAYARVDEAAIEEVHEGLAEDEEQARAQLDAAFERFESEQPALAAFVGEALSDPLDDTALALGYFLALAIWMAFGRAHGSDVGEVGLDDIQATRELLELDEELRRADPTEVLDTDDVVAIEQPALLSFVNQHLDATLQAHADTIDVDDVHQLYRTVLIEILTLSYAVKQPVGFPKGKAELLA